MQSGQPINSFKVYSYAKCSTCRKALKWLSDNGIKYEEHPIVDSPPGTEELDAMLGHYNGEIRRLFNTSGMDYRALGLKDKIPTLSKEEAFELLRSNGMLVKRPFLLGENVGLVGFRAEQWESLLK